MTDLCTREVVDSSERGLWPATLWPTLAESGLTLSGVSEAAGGSGGQVADALAVVRQAARFGAPLPLAETLMAAKLLEITEQNVPTGPLTVVSDPGNLNLTRSEGSVLLSGNATNVPWAGESVSILLRAGEQNDER